MRLLMLLISCACLPMGAESVVFLEKTSMLSVEVLEKASMVAESVVEESVHLFLATKCMSAGLAAVAVAALLDFLHEVSLEARARGLVRDTYALGAWAASSCVYALRTFPWGGGSLSPLARG